MTHLVGISQQLTSRVLLYGGHDENICVTVGENDGKFGTHI